MSVIPGPRLISALLLASSPSCSIPLLFLFLRDSLWAEDAPQSTVGL